MAFAKKMGALWEDRKYLGSSVEQDGTKQDQLHQGSRRVALERIPSEVKQIVYRTNCKRRAYALPEKKRKVWPHDRQQRSKPNLKIEVERAGTRGANELCGKQPRFVWRRRRHMKNEVENQNEDLNVANEEFLKHAEAVSETLSHAPNGHGQSCSTW